MRRLMDNVSALHHDVRRSGQLNDIPGPARSGSTGEEPGERSGEVSCVSWLQSWVRCPQVCEPGAYAAREEHW